jgi:hypothetical protein
MTSRKITGQLEDIADNAITLKTKKDKETESVTLPITDRLVYKALFDGAVLGDTITYMEGTHAVTISLDGKFNSFIKQYTK